MTRFHVVVNAADGLEERIQFTTEEESAADVAATNAATIRQAREAKAADIAQTMTEARLDAFVQQFVNMTNADRNDYVDTACAGLPAPARNFLKKLTMLLHVDAKDKFK